MNSLDDDVILTYEDLIRDPDMAELAMRRGRRMHALAITGAVSAAVHRLFDTDAPAASKVPSAPATTAVAKPDTVRTGTCG